MAKKTLLDIVQDILSDADGDEVNSINDTIESLQCARCVRTSFDHIVDGSDLKMHTGLDQLEATTSATPNIMTRPEGVYEIQWIKYDIRQSGTDPKFETVSYVHPDELLDIMDSRTLGDSNIESVAHSSGHNLLVRNDKAPQYWSIIDGYDEIVFDSYDSDLESNLQKSKSQVYGVLKPTLTLSDSAEPDLPKNLMIRLQSDARALFFDLYKDGVTSEVDRLRRRAEVRSQRERHITKYGERTRNTFGPDYGRKVRG